MIKLFAYLIGAAIAVFAFTAVRSNYESNKAKIDGEIQKQAQSLGDQVAKEAEKKLDPKGSVRSAVTGVQEADEVLKKVQAGKFTDPQVKSWVEKNLNNSSAAAQKLSVHLFEEAHKHSPEAKKWAEAQVKEVMGKSTGATKQMWQDVLDNWQRAESITKSQL